MANALTRDILDYLGNVIGQLVLPEGTPESVWQEILSAHAQSPPAETQEEMMRRIILGAMAFGRDIIAAEAVKNLESGFTTEQVREVLERTKDVINALNVGALNVALAELDLVTTDDVIVTTVRIEGVRTMIKTYLGIA